MPVAFVVHSWGLNRDLAGPGDHIAFTGVAVADHHAFPGGVDHIGVGIEIGAAFREQGGSEHLLGGDAAQLVEVDRGGLLEVVGRVDRVGMGLD